MLRSDLCDFTDASIVVKGTITLTKTKEWGIIDIRSRFLAFKNNAPFTNCISNINNVLIDNAEDLDAVMSMHNLLEYSNNYRKTTRSLWNYYRDKPNDFPANNFNANPIAYFESFKYKSSLAGKTTNANQENGENTEEGNTKTNKYFEIVAPLKHLSTFWRSLDMSLINCEVSLTLTWSESCVLTDITTQSARAAQGDNPARPAINASTNATWETQNCIYQLLLYQLKMIKNSRNN